MMLERSVKDIRDYFCNELEDARNGEEGIYEIDRSGMKMVEMLAASFIADEPAIFGTPNQDYINAEIAWYESASTNINDIDDGRGEPPKAWQLAANFHGEINSNYGHLIWSDKYHNQMEKVIWELSENRSSRRACIVYNRPSIWAEYNENGKNDFICTNAVTYYIRNEELQAVVQMRSNDIIYGYKNDYAWQRYVMDKICEGYNKLEDPDLHIKPGFMLWQVQNLHLYERHFHLVSA